MKLLIIVITILIFSVSCISQKESSDYRKPIISANFQDPAFEKFLNTSSVASKGMFLAVSSRLQFREEERQYALIHAASQVSIYQNVDVFARTGIITTGSVLSDRLLEEVRVQYSRDRLLAISEELEVIEEYQDNFGTYLLVSHDNFSYPNINFRYTINAGTPDWLYTIPEISGYHVSVGYAQRTQFVGNSIIAADERALAQMANQISLTVLDDLIHEDSRLGRRLKSVGYQVSDISLKGFYILSRGISPDGQYFYSLGVLPK